MCNDRITIRVSPVKVLAGSDGNNGIGICEGGEHANSGPKREQIVSHRIFSQKEAARPLREGRAGGRRRMRRKSGEEDPQ